MALKFVLDSLEGLSEEVAANYSKHTDGKYYLDVEGAVAKSKVDEFRENNIKMANELKEYQEKFKDIDPEKYRALQKKIDELEGGNENQITQEDVDKIVADRTKKMKEEYDNQINQLTDTNQKQGQRLNELLVDGAVRNAALEAKVRQPAIEDVILRANRVFKVVDGKAVAHDEDGKIVYGKDGATPMSPSEWVGSLKTNAPHLFEQSQGGGAGGGGRPGTGGQNTGNLSALQKIAQGLSSSE